MGLHCCSDPVGRRSALFPASTTHHLWIRSECLECSRTCLGRTIDGEWNDLTGGRCTSRRRIVDVVGPYADGAGSPFRRNVENTGRDLLDPVAKVHKAVKQIARGEVRVSGKVLQGGPGDRARNALAFGVDRKCDAVPIPPWLRNKRLIPSGFHIMPKIHVSHSLKQQIPDGSAVKSALRYMGTNQRLTSYIARIHHSLHHGSMTLADRLYGAMLVTVRSNQHEGPASVCQRHCRW